ncbi:hypothetical protein [Microbacterium sp. S1037]|uniref:hypothetical protein n=1 Tax=Microbacterium sp. S1037 TaxID=3398227 RepID=UPI003AAFC8F3
MDLQQESRDEDAVVAEPEGVDASSRDSEGESVAVVDPNPKTTPRRRMSRALVAGGVILAAAAVVVASPLVKALFSESESTTVVETFVPSEADIEAAADLGDDGLHAECAARSYSSARTDARMCLVANFLRDPCFLTESDRAVCPDVEGLGSNFSGRALSVLLSGTVDPDWLGSGDLVGAEQVASTDYPWAFQLDHRDEDGQPYLCQVDVRKLVSFKAASFSCSTTGSHTRVILDKEAFITGKHMISIQPDDVVIATDFQRTSPQWSVAVQLPGSNKLERIDITEAWF